MRKVQPRYFVFGGLVSLGCGLAMSELSGQSPLHDRAPPPCVLNGPCLPNRETWGYYQPKWRRWPGTILAAEPDFGQETGLEGTTVPRPEEEDVRVPLPVPPGGAGGADATREPASTPLPGAAAPAAEPNPAAPLVPFEPTPAAPLPGPGPGLGGLPEAPLPNSALPNAPLPGGPVPNVAPQPPVGNVPQPGGIDLSEPNPFDGSSTSDVTAPQGNVDPPPMLPASLRSSRRDRDARRAAEQTGSRPNFASGLTRLPSPVDSRVGRTRYDVHQASATVWASGTDDILPADPNAGRVQQAIHHEAVE